jgi:hypothetical protein
MTPPFRASTVEGLTASGTEAEHGEVIVEGCDIVNAESAHHGEAGAINDGEILVTPGVPDFPGNLKICQTDSLHDRPPSSQAIPKSLRGVALNSVMEQRPGLYQNVIRSDQLPPGLEDSFGPSIAAIGRICRDVPDRCVKE